jgi:hypothetical protein
MSKPKLTPWLSGNPVHVGEYIASSTRFECHLRWWNGKFWSDIYYKLDSQSTKNYFAGKKAKLPKAAKIEYKGLAENPHD